MMMSTRVVAPLDVEVVVRVAHIDLDRVAVLVLLNADAVFADLVARGFDLGFDRVLIPGGDADVGVGRLDPQVGLAAEVVGLRPFVGMGGQHGETATARTASDMRFRAASFIRSSGGRAHLRPAS